VDDLTSRLAFAPASTAIGDQLRPGPPRRELLSPVLRLYLLVGLAALAAFYAMPHDSLFQDTIYYPALGFASVVTIVAGIVWYRPSHALPWLLFAAGQLLFVAGDVLFGVYEHVLGETAVPSPADALYLLGYPVLAAGLWLLVRQRSSRTDWTSLIDAATVTMALGIVAWELLIVPYTRDDTLSAGERLVSIAYPLGDVLLLAVAARLVFGTAVRTVSHILIVLSLVCLLVADPLYALLTIRGEYGSGSPVDAGWILAYLFFGAAALHPSMRRVSGPAADTVPRLTPGRLAFLAAAALAAPAVLAYQPERIGVACTAALIVLVGARLAGIVTRHERALARESKLRAAAATLVAATTDEEIHRAAVETAVAFAGGTEARATLGLENADGWSTVATAGESPALELEHEIFPLVVMGEPRGALELETASGVAEEDRAALETLADQVALALETVARAREKADAERRHIHDVFSRFVPEAVVEEVLAQTDGARLGGRTLDGTLMFTDLRGFTSFSESRPADEVISVVNRFLSEQTDTIMAHGGTIIAYLGDGLMAAFGAPIEQSDHADRALRASRELIGTRLPALNDWMREHGYGDGFRMGIGLNSGSFISGNVGSERRLEYTAIGDVCNTASRIQDLTKGTRHMLLFSGSTLEALSAAPADLVDFGDAAIRGRLAHIALWSLESISDAA
jgi:class 3 adenylate cyclase